MNKKRWLWIVAGVIALLALYLIYPRTRNAFLINRAEKSFAAGEDRKATLQAMRLIQIDRDYAPASKLLADIAEKNLSRDSLRWRLMSVRSDPSAANQIALARTAIYFQEWEWADKALKAVAFEDRQTPAFLQTAGSLALALNRYDDAAHFFKKAHEADLDNKLFSLNLAITRLALNNPELQAKARQDLQQLKEQPEFAVPALMALLQDAMARSSSPEILARELLSHPCGFKEKIAALGAFAKGGTPDAANLLADLQKNHTASGEIYIVSNWMIRQGKASEAKTWLDTLDSEKRKDTPIPMAYAECLVSLQDWKKLEAHVSGNKWEDSEILRHAFLWRARRELSPNSRSDTGTSEWQSSLRSGSVRPGELYLAASLLWSWGWKSEAEGIWWDLAAQTQNPGIALRTLDQIYRAQKNTNKLWWISQKQCLTNPRDKVAQNNYAMLSLLLKLDLSKAHTLAGTLHREQPDNVAFLSTYAFSLYRQGKTREALNLFSTLKPQILEKPEYAFYYALFLKTAGQETESERYAKLAEKAQLLPEERALLE